MKIYKINPDVLKELYVSNMPVKEIAKKLDVGVVTIYKALKLHGIPNKRVNGARKDCICETCGKKLSKTPSRYNLAEHHFCSRKCTSDFYRLRNKVEKTTQVYRRTSGKNLNSLQHRAIMEQHLGRKLKRNEYVHHKDEDKHNNEIENLEIMTPQEHNDLHLRKYPNEKVCIVCDKEYTPKKTKRKRNKVCSQECKLKVIRDTTDKQKIPIEQYDLSMNLIRRWDGISDVQKELGFYNSNICKCLKGKIPTAYGYVWKYA